MDAPGVEAVVCVWRCVSVGLKLPYLAVIRPFIGDINQTIEHQFHLNMWGTAAEAVPEAVAGVSLVLYSALSAAVLSPPGAVLNLSGMLDSFWYRFNVMYSWECVPVRLLEK